MIRWALEIIQPSPPAHMAARLWLAGGSSRSLSWQWAALA